MQLGSFGLFVEDMEKMVTFYRDVMQLEIEWDGGSHSTLDKVAPVSHLDEVCFFNIFSAPNHYYKFISSLSARSIINNHHIRPSLSFKSRIDLPKKEAALDNLNVLNITYRK